METNLLGRKCVWHELLCEIVGVNAMGEVLWLTPLEGDVSGTIQVVPISAISLADHRPGYTVRITNIGSNKIEVIKAIRALTGVGLKDAKDICENPTFVFKTDAQGHALTRSAAQTFKDELEMAGAMVEIRAPKPTGA